MSNSSNLTEKPRSTRTPRREVWWHDIGEKNQSLESIKRRFEDFLDRFPSSSSNPLLPRVVASTKYKDHQCSGYLREEITLLSDVSKSVIMSHAFPSSSEVCLICGQLVDVSIGSALKYLDKIKRRCDPDTYQRYLDILSHFKNEIIDTVCYTSFS